LTVSLPRFAVTETFFCSIPRRVGPRWRRENSLDIANDGAVNVGNGAIFEKNNANFARNSTVFSDNSAVFSAICSFFADFPLDPLTPSLEFVLSRLRQLQETRFSRVTC